MDQTMQRCSFIVTLVIAALAVSPGCGGSRNTVWVTGKLLKAGAKYVPPEGQLVTVAFVGMEIEDSSGKMVQSSEAFLAAYDQASASFSVPGNDGRGIPPGRYRVAVVQRLTRETFDAKKSTLKKGPGRPDRETDQLKNRFGMETSPIIREVKKSGEIIVDLDQPT
jgi:hypothetical protein